MLHKKLDIPNCIEKRISISKAEGGQIIILLRTDSAHLAKFFTMNWLADNSSVKPNAIIIALKGSAKLYGLSQDLDGFRWFCPKTNQVWMFDNEFYGNIKITVRGLCSEIVPAEETFLHGCSMSIDGHGLVLSGSSGAGKTTLTTVFRRLLGSRLKIINDDWGPCSLVSGQLKFTGEPHLHMKYPSVHALAPKINLNPSFYPSENFHGDVKDPRARLLIDPRKVFGQKDFINEAKLQLFVMVTRDPSKPIGIKFLSTRDLFLFEQGQYSDFYERTERFLNGSLFFVNNNQEKRESNRCRMLLKKFPCISINNVGNPEKTAKLILTEFEKIILSKR